MQKFAETPDKKLGRRMPEKVTVPAKRRNLTSLQR